MALADVARPLPASAPHAEGDGDLPARLQRPDPHHDPRLMLPRYKLILTRDAVIKTLARVRTALTHHT